MKLIPDNFKSEIDLRIRKLKEKMHKHEASSVLIAANTNIYYLTGRFFRGYVYLDLESEPLWFIIKPSNFELSDNLITIRKPEQIPDIFLSRGFSMPTSLGLEMDDLSYNDIIRLHKLFPGSKLINASRILKETRMVKTPFEISEMESDGIHQSRVYSKIKNCYRPGMTDLQLQIEIERELRLEGSLGVSRVSGNLMEINLGSVIMGDNADVPSPYEFTMGGSGVDTSLPVGAANNTILSGQTVMIDMNGAFNGYQTDMTRIWALDNIPELAQRAHDCSIKILRTLEEIAIPGLPVASLYEKAIDIVKEENLSEFFMGHKSQVGFIGHGVGIELNELPVVNSKSKDILEENMTIALEPKFVLPHIGAVGVENTYQVTQKGLKNLTVFPEEIQLF